MKVRFYNFTKKVNSCKQPTGVYTQKDCAWKDTTSSHNPVIVVEGAPQVNWNYAYIVEWNHCYFVEDCRSVASNLTEYTLREDVLATFRSAIRDSTQRVAFCSDAAGYDKYRVDPRIAVSTTKTTKTIEHTMSLLNSTGCYILTVYNNSPLAAGVGFGVSYMLNAANMGKVREWLGDATVMSSLITYFGGSPLEAIFGCMWVPFAYTESDTTIGAVVNSVLIGNHNSSIDGFSVTAVRLYGFVTKGEGFTLSFSGQLRDDFRRCEPYTSACLSLPGCGVMDINVSDWIDSVYISVNAVFELNTGNIIYYLRTADGHLVQTASAQLGAQCPLGQMNTNVSGVVNAVGGLVGAGVGLALGGAFGAAAAGAMLASGASAVLNANKRAPSISGHVGGRISSYVGKAELTIFEVQTQNPGDSDYVACMGRASGKAIALSSLIGFVQCENASVPIAGSREEADEINGFLNGGFFME